MEIKILYAIDCDDMYAKINLLAIPKNETPDVNDVQRILINKMFDEDTEGLDDLCDKIACGQETELNEYVFMWETIELCNRSM